ncbi:MAG: hypothetical protein RLZ14_502 [Actinomycetota bacterium]
MDALRLAAAVSCLTAVALWAGSRSLHRAPRSLDEGRRLLAGSVVTSSRNSFAEAFVADRLGEHLSLADTTAAAVATRLLAAAAVMFFAVLAGVVALLGAGLLPVSPLWLALPAGAAAMAVWVTWRGVVAAAERRRQQLRQAANDFVQLVAVGLTTDQSVEEAIRFAVRVGGSAAFMTLRNEILSAPQRGVAVWEAIEELGRSTGIGELVEFATAVERQGVQGVSIGESVAALASSMRAAALDQLEREADRANANLSGPTVGFVVATVVFLAYPLAQRISEAFGG